MGQSEQALKSSVLDDNAKREIEPIQFKAFFDFCEAFSQNNCAMPFQFFGEVWYFSLNVMNFRV